MNRLLNWLNNTRRVLAAPVAIQARSRRSRPTLEALEQRLNPGGLGPDLGITASADAVNYQVGQTVTYFLTVTNGASAGAVQLGTPITVTDLTALGFSNVTASAGFGWSFTSTSTTSPALLTASYTGEYPVVAGETLPIITITGTANGNALGIVANVSSVSVAGDLNLANNTATVDVDITNAATAPTATNGSVALAENTPKSLTVTASDTNLPALPLTYAITTEPLHGTLTGSGPNFVYTPNFGYSGPDSFQFKANNGSSDSNIATESITVVAPAFAIGQSVTTPENTPVSFTLLADTPLFLELTYTVTTPPANGTLSGSGANLTYTPNAGYVGPDSFQFTVNNGTSDSNVATEALAVTSVTAPPPSLTPDERYVRALYQADLGRTGTPAERSGWVAELQAPGGTRDSVASGVLHTPEARDHLVQGWYQTYLGRAAAGGEEQGWVNQLLQGASEEQTLSGILSSPEFYGRAQTQVSTGSADQRYVQQLYQALLTRTPSASEVAGWVNMLPTMGRQGVARSFMKGNSATEYRTDQVEAYYSTLLSRTGESSGLADWVYSNMDMAGIRTGIEASLEFYNNA